MNKTMNRVLTLPTLRSSTQQGLPLLGGLLLLSALSACGGGGTETGSSTPTHNALQASSTVGAEHSKDDAGVADTGASSRTDANRTPVPTGLHARLDRASSSIHLTWTAAADPATAYRVYWAQDALPDSTAAYTDVYATTYTQTNLLEGSTYAFRISAWLNGVESAGSPALTVVNTAAPAARDRTSDTGL